MSDLATALLLATLAGSTIPLGAYLASRQSVLPDWLASEVRHSITAIGGGALLSAVAFVLLPQAITRVPPVMCVFLFFAGGVVFFFVDRALNARGGAGALLLAMVLDYVPEAMALGALIGGEPEIALLTALLIAVQNLPESFSAYREVTEVGRAKATTLMAVFTSMALLGPAAAMLGLFVLADMPGVLGGVMAFAAGGILYLLFEDVAPNAKLQNSGAPALGAVIGFAIGLSGFLALG